MHPEASDIVGVGIEIDGQDHLWKLNRNSTLDEIIEAIVTEFNKEQDPKTRGLLFRHCPDSDHKNKYVSETNKNDINNGFVLKLVESYDIFLARIFHSISSNGVLAELDKHLHDEFILQAMYKFEYHDIINKLLLAGKFNDDGEIVICLRIVSRLIDEGLLQKISKRFAGMITNFIVYEMTTPDILIIATKLAKQILLMKPEEHINYIVSKVKIYDHLMLILKKFEHPLLQYNTLCLINTYCKVITDHGQYLKCIKVMGSEVMRKLIYTNIITKPNRSIEIDKELHIYQTNMLSTIEMMILDRVSLNEENKKLSELQENMQDIFNKNSFSKTVSMTDIGNTLQNCEQPLKFSFGQDFPESPLLPIDDFVFFSNYERTRGSIYHRSITNDNTGKKPLGNVAMLRRHFEDPGRASNRYEYSLRTRSKSPIIEKRIRLRYSDQKNSPSISQLTLSCLRHFKNSFPQSFFIAMEEGNIYPPGFFITCDRILSIVCEQLNVGKSPKKNSDMYCPLAFLALDVSLFIPDFFCRIMWCFVRTRSEMNARSEEDQEKVLRVLEKQIYEALRKKPLTYQALTWTLKTLTYTKISLLWQKERNRKWQEVLYKVPSIWELRESINQDTIKLIRENRLNRMKIGNVFYKFDRDKKPKSTENYIKLSKNHQQLVIGEWNAQSGSYIFNHAHNILLSDVKHLVVGKAILRECKPQNLNLSFSLRLENDISLDFMALDDSTFDIWTDGFNILLGKEMESKTYQRDKMQLTEMELTISLLDVENICLPYEPPPIPDLPPSFEFCTN